MEKVDVVVENFRPGALDRIGLSYQQACACNPRLVYCSISGYGQNGPARDQSAMDLILEASCGLISVTGTRDGQQVRCGHSVADITAGMFSVIGILLALRSRDWSGVGQWVDVSMFDSMISAMSANFMNYLGSGRVPRPLGTAFDQIVPYCTSPTKDRAISIAAGSEKLWGVLCRVLERSELINHPDYATNALRVAHRGVLEPMLAEIFLHDTAENWFRRLNGVGFPCSPVRTLDEVVDDAQAAIRDMFPVIEHPTAGRVKVTGPPIKFSATPGKLQGAAPLLGQHNSADAGGVVGVGSQEAGRFGSDGRDFAVTVAGLLDSRCVKRFLLDKQAVMSTQLFCK